ncbi:MAG: hypothetical protein ACYSWP_22460 [Planctomycetota bacterium]|jgi:hypothetical protein
MKNIKKLQKRLAKIGIWPTSDSLCDLKLTTLNEEPAVIVPRWALDNMIERMEEDIDGKRALRKLIGI